MFILHFVHGGEKLIPVGLAFSYAKKSRPVCCRRNQPCGIDGADMSIRKHYIAVIIMDFSIYCTFARRRRVSCCFCITFGWVAAAIYFHEVWGFANMFNLCQAGDPEPVRSFIPTAGCLISRQGTRAAGDDRTVICPRWFL